MTTSLITLGGNTVTLVAAPSVLTAKEVQFTTSDQVSTVVSPFTQQTQTQIWPGADSWSVTVTLPPMKREKASAWIGALMELRGMANAMQLGDPDRQHPCGRAPGVPVANTSGGTGYNAAGTTTLYTRGWVASQARILLPGDNLQIGYRLHTVTSAVSSDADGNAAISIWPSLREVPADGEAIILDKPMGLFRLAKNDRKWTTSLGRVTSLSFDLIEYR